MKNHCRRWPVTNMRGMGQAEKHCSVPVRVGSDTRGETWPCPLRGRPCKKRCTLCHAIALPNVIVRAQMDSDTELPGTHRLQLPKAMICNFVLGQAWLCDVLCFRCCITFTGPLKVKPQAVTWSWLAKRYLRLETQTWPQNAGKEPLVSKCESQIKLAKLGLPLQGECTCSMHKWMPPAPARAEHSSVLLLLNQSLQNGERGSRHTVGLLMNTPTPNESQIPAQC